MRRRAFIALVGGAIAGWPIRVIAQQSSMPVIGFLDTATPGSTAPFLAAFRQGLLESGFVEGRDVLVEYRWAENNNDRLPTLAADLVQRQVTVIVGSNLPSALAAKAATSSIPVVFGIGGDPVALGLVASLNRPGGNVTGVTLQSIEAYGKRVQLLRDLIPTARSVAFLTNPTNRRNAEDEAREAENAGRMLGLQMLSLSASTTGEIDLALEAVVQQRAQALVVSADPFFVAQRDQLIRLAAYHAVPAAYARREFALGGGLISYGASLTDAYRHGGIYVGKILKGAQPNDLPVQQPTKFDLVVNLKTAKELGIAVPPPVLARADEVIE